MQLIFLVEKFIAGNNEANQLTLFSAKKFQKLSENRLREARALEKIHEYPGAYYLGGYVIECGLKAIIAKKFKANAIPDHSYVRGVFTHNLTELLNRAGLIVPKELKARWGLISKWTEQSRYDLSKSKDDLKPFLKAIDEKGNGLFEWVKKHW